MSAGDPKRTCTTRRTCVAAFALWVRPPTRRVTLRPSSSRFDVDRMDRRDFIAATAAVLVSSQPSWAQGTPRRVGYLDLAPKYLPFYKVWLDSLRDHGWI